MVNSSVDWCEDNYVYSAFVAEMWNSLSSIILVYAGWIGYRKNRHWKGSSVFLLLMAVGVGSIVFHALLTASSQMLDEIPMIFLLHAILLSVYGVTSTWKIVSTYAIATAMSAMIIHTVFLQNDENKTYDSVESYGLSSGVNRIEFYLFQSLIILGGVCLIGRLVIKVPHEKNVIYVCIRGCAVFALAWCGWLVDFFYCDELRKGQMNPQLHAWWHCGSAIAVYALCIVSIMLENSDQHLRILDDGRILSTLFPQLIKINVK
jgi:dihydroceramidase